MAWRIDGIGNTFRHAAEKAAGRAGLSTGTWLDKVLLAHPAGRTRQDADAEIERALAALETRIEESSARIDTMLAPINAEVDRLTAESEKLRTRDKLDMDAAQRALASRIERLESGGHQLDGPGGDAARGPPPGPDREPATTAERKPELTVEAEPDRGRDRSRPPDLAVIPDPEEDNHDPWTRHHPHPVPKFADDAVLRRRRMIRWLGGAGAVALIAMAITGGYWVIAVIESETAPPPVPVAQVRSNADQTPPRGLVPAPGLSPAGIAPAARPATAPAPAQRNGAPSHMDGIRAKAEGQDPQAQYELGLALLEGRATSVNPREGSEWIVTAAVAGHPQAQLLLAKLYSEGRGVPPDPTQVFFWTQSAAERGIVEAMYRLGMIYSQGIGVDRSHALAARWFRDAGEKGNAAALFQLGLIYELGLDFRANRRTALEWYRKAAAAGSTAAAEKIKALESGATTPATAPPPKAAVAPQPKLPAAPQAKLPAAPSPAPRAAPGALPDILSQAEVREIQQLLKSLDIEPGPIDGVMRARTADAIRQYQTMTGLPADGEASRALLGNLRELTGRGR